MAFNEDKYKIVIEPELLLALYWGNLYSSLQISNLFKVSKSTILNRLSDYYIPTRSISEANNGRIPWNRDKSGCYTRESLNKMSNAKIGKKHMNNCSCALCSYKYGDKNPNWKGGISCINTKIRNTVNYINWRNNIYIRDDFRCAVCNKRGVRLNVHHLNPLSEIIIKHNIKTLNDSYKCDELWDTSNGITLCKECHIKIHKDDKYKGID